MTEKLRKFGMEMDLSHMGGGEAPCYVKNSVKRDLDGWREVLIPIAAVLRWDQPYHPTILLGSTTFLFTLIWLFDLSTLTTISVIGLSIGLLDFGVPYFGPKITGYTDWTSVEEYQFTNICENIANFESELCQVWQGFVTMRQNNSKMFFLIVMGVLSVTAWIGNLVNNLLLTYIVVSFCLCLPGLQSNETTSVYMRRVGNAFRKIRAILMKPKEE